MEKEDFLLSIENLLFWLDRKGYTVTFDSTGTDDICLNSKTISMKNHDVEKKFYILAHECGHIIVGNTIFDEMDKKEKKARTIIEEVLAWEQAKKLLKKLKIKYEEEQFEKMKIDAIHKYCCSYKNI